MTDAFVIEVDGEAVGLVLKEREGFRFVAANRDHTALDGRLFPTAFAAERAAIDLRRCKTAA
jgi:hypothetical protein